MKYTCHLLRVLNCSTSNFNPQLVSWKRSYHIAFLFVCPNTCSGKSQDIAADGPDQFSVASPSVHKPFPKFTRIVTSSTRPSVVSLDLLYPLQPPRLSSPPSTLFNSIPHTLSLFNFLYALWFPSPFATSYSSLPHKLRFHSRILLPSALRTTHYAISILRNLNFDLRGWRLVITTRSRLVFCFSY